MWNVWILMFWLIFCLYLSRCGDHFYLFKASRIADDLSCYSVAQNNLQNYAYRFGTPAELQVSKFRKSLIRKHVLLGSRIQLIYIDLKLLGAQLAGKRQRDIEYLLFDQQITSKQHIMCTIVVSSRVRLFGFQTCISMFARFTSVLSEFRKILNQHQIS